MEHSVDGSKPVERPSTEDIAREQTALAIQAIEPKPFPASTNEDQYRLYTGENRRVCHTMEILRDLERAQSIVHCRTCMESAKYGIVKATPLVIKYEEDGLKATPMLCLPVCHACGFEMVVNMKRVPDFMRPISQAEQMERDRQRQVGIQAAMGQQQFGGVAQGMENINRLRGMMDAGQHLNADPNFMREIQEQLAHEINMNVSPPVMDPRAKPESLTDRVIARKRSPY